MKKFAVLVLSLITVFAMTACAGSGADKPVMGDGPQLENMTLSPAALKSDKEDIMKDQSKDNHFFNYKVNDEDTCAKVELHTYKDGKWETQMIAGVRPLENIDGSIGLGFNKIKDKDEEEIVTSFIVAGKKGPKMSICRTNTMMKAVEGNKGFVRVWSTGTEPIVMGTPQAVMGDFSTELGDSPNLANYQEFKGEFAQVITVTFADKL